MDAPFSLFLMNNTNTTQQPQEPNTTTTQLGPNPERSSQVQKGRKPGGSGNKNSNTQAKRNKKKTPQRGMGVAQLERLRMQETLKSFTESSNQTDPSPSTCGFPPPPSQLQVLNFLQLPPSQATPYQYPQGCFYGVPVIGGGGGSGNGHGLVGLDQQGKRINGHDHHHDANRMQLSGKTSGGLGSDRVMVSPFSCYNSGALPAGFGPSRELSSMPKMTMYHQQQQHQHGAGFQYCDVCLKLQKMKFEEEKLRFYGRKENFGQTSSGYGYGLLGLNQQNNTLFSGDISGFSARAARSAFHANQNSNQGVEPVEAHMKGDSSAEEEGALKEYEFFPGKRGKRNHPNENEFTSGASGVAGGASGEASSCVTTSENHSGCLGASNASSSVDLSLKLSC